MKFFFFFLGIIVIINNVFNVLDIRNWKIKLIGFGVDGVFINLGKNVGVVVKLKEDMFWLIDIYCLLYRLELVLLEF